MTCLVGFMALAPDAHPLTVLLRSGHTHCWMAREIDAGLWLWLEWTPDRLVHGLVAPAIVTRQMEDSASVLHLPWPGPAGLASGAARRRFPRPVISCVTVIADALGLPLPPWATPWRLACALRKHGARAITAPMMEGESR
jgi:hypothetical protein